MPLERLKKQDWWAKRQLKKKKLSIYYNIFLNNNYCMLNPVRNKKLQILTFIITYLRWSLLILKTHHQSQHDKLMGICCKMTCH